MSKSSFCVQPPSRSNFLATCRCFSIQSSFVFFQSWSQPGNLLQFFTLVLRCTLLPVVCPGLLQKHLLHVLWAVIISCPLLFALQVYHCGHLMPKSRVSHLSLVSTSEEPEEPDSTMILFVLQAFSSPYPFCPSLSSHNRELFFHFKAKGFHEQGQRGCTRFARCCCHLPPQFQPFCRNYFHCMYSPRPCWHHTRS